MLKRKIWEELIKWKNEPTKKSLVIKGARQVGKSFIVDKFAQEFYDEENYIKINFEKQESRKKIFEGDLDVDTIIKQISSLELKKRFVPGKTLIFFDEIQKCDRARTSLKYFTEDGRYDVITSGSLLGISNYKKNDLIGSVPVGYTTTLHLYSLDFEEFLWSKGFDEEKINVLKNYAINRKMIPKVLHDNYNNFLKEYIVVGGMPEVVSCFQKSNSFGETLEVQKRIVNDYKDDIIKYSKNSEQAKIRECFNSIPVQLSRENKKFKFSTVEQKARKRTYKDSLMWLKDADIVNLCSNLNTLNLPLEGNVLIDEFKVYMNDIGLLVSMLEEGSANDILNDNLKIYKGAIFENLVADILTKKNIRLYYFQKTQYSSNENTKLKSFEIDFVLREKNTSKIKLLEVKAKNGTCKSLSYISNKYSNTEPIKLTTKFLQDYDNIKCFPLYLLFFIL